MEPLLLIVDELERRDEDAAAALHEVESLQQRVDETRARARDIAAFLEAFPDDARRARGGGARRRGVPRRRRRML